MSSTLVSKSGYTSGMAIIVTDAAREAFAERLKEWRERQGITQHDLSMELGCSFATVSKWEQATAYPRALHIRRALREQTGIDVDQIAREYANGGERAQERD